MKKRQFISLMLCSCMPVISVAQALFNSGAVITISAGTTVNVQGDLTNSIGSTIDNSGTLRITGNSVNNGTTSSPSGANLALIGTTPQTLSGSSTLNVRDMIVNNAAGITVSTPVQVTGALTLTSGIVTTSNAASPVIFSATATLANTPTDASHINGYVQKLGNGAFTFPVGDATKYQPVGVNLTANGTGMTARFVVGDAGTAPFGTTGSSATPLKYYSHAEYWDLTPASSATGNVTIYFDAYNRRTIGNTADVRVAHKTGGQWLNEGASSVTGTTVTGTVTSNSISSWSPFALGSISSSSPLPVALISFRGRRFSDGSHLEWQTGVEDGGATFDIQRSETGVAFRTLGTVPGKGNNNSYSFLDDQPIDKVAYYRLGINATEGVKYSQVVALLAEAITSGKVIISPVPAATILTITNTDRDLNGSDAIILGVDGRIVAQFKLEAIQTLDVRRWANGLYVMRLKDGSSLQILKQ